MTLPIWPTSWAKYEKFLSFFFFFILFYSLCFFFFFFQRDELRAAGNHDQFPRLYGGCWADLWSSRTVLEYVEGWLALCEDTSLDCMTAVLSLARLADRLASQSTPCHCCEIS